MSWIKTLWNDMLPKTIASYWTYTRLMRADSTIIMSVSHLLERCTSVIDKRINSVVTASVDRMSCSEFLNPEWEDNVFQEVKDSSIVASIVSKLSASNCAVVEEDEEECKPAFELPNGKKKGIGFDKDYL